MKQSLAPIKENMFPNAELMTRAWSQFFIDASDLLKVVAREQTVRTVTASGDITLDDYMVICDSGSTAITLTIPLAKDSKHRTFVIHNKGTGVVTVTGVTTVNHDGTLTMFSDGIDWMVL
jgi:hypothetical protein